MIKNANIVIDELKMYMYYFKKIICVHPIIYIHLTS